MAYRKVKHEAIAAPFNAIAHLASQCWITLPNPQFVYCCGEEAQKMLPLEHCVMWGKILFTISNKLDCRVMLLRSYYGPNSSAY